MNKENGTAVRSGEPTARITRAQAKGLSILEGLPPRRPSRKHDHKPTLKQSSKRTASDEKNSSISYTSCFQHKKRALLEDVTNIFSNPLVNCTQFSKQANKGIGKKTAKVAPAIFIENSCVQEGVEANITEEMSTVETKDSHEPILPVNLKEHVAHEQTKPIGTREVGEASMILAKQASNKHTYPKNAFRKGGKSCENLEASTSLESLKIADVDSNHKDPLMCSMYAPDIYSNLLVMELDRRPSVNYMEILQREITPGMRGVLVDWLVEVSEEYKLVPDTLYLTVNVVDRFLSQNHIEKQRLQLLGVTSVLIASKYEEICAPSVEELCIITDNTYKRQEVVKMESQVLNFLGFHLSYPTTKKFLRRFIQAAQTSFKVPCVELEFLANYLAELSLLEYRFLKFLPSLIAASAVFLARWTLNQSDHPWNPTLEHYTSYMPSDLKGSVLALQQLQLNSNECSLKAIREKYRHQKFKCVANLSSPEAVDSVF